MKRNESRKASGGSKRIKWLATGTAMVSLWTLLALFGPGPDFRFCMFRSMIELPCPGCGMVRALTALSRFELTQSFAFHPMAAVLAVQAIGLWVAWGFRTVRVGPTISSRTYDLVLLGNAVMFVLIWLVRYLAGLLPY